MLATLNGGVFCMGDGVMGMGWMMGFGTLWLAVLIGGVAIVIWVITRASGSGRDAGHIRTPTGDPSLAILRERFARGEITETEYRTNCQILEESLQSDHDT